MSDAILFHAAIIEPDASARGRLRQACAASGRFDDAVMSKDTSEILHRFNSGEEFDVVFLSGRVERDETKFFLERLAKASAARNTACILVGEHVCRELEVVANLFDGFDGVLFEPFSVEALAEVTSIVLRVQHDRMQRRERVAIDLLVRELAGLIGELAVCEAGGYKAPTTRRVLQELKTVLTELSPDASEYYYHALTEQFGNLNPPRRRVYNGVSNRIRQKVQEKLETSSQRRLDLINELKRISAG